MIVAIIPARYDSSRLPGKPLMKIGDRSIIQRTYEQTCKSHYIQRVIVATDDDRIANHVREFGGEVVMTGSNCLNGTERICQALAIIDPDEQIQTVVNVQGDEPFINPSNINYCIEKYLEHEDQPDMVCTTIHYPVTDPNDLGNHTIGKMVMDRHQQVLYCSRAMIPHTKSGAPGSVVYNAHIGIFVFRRSYLQEYLSENTPAQLSEDIEWLKILEQGYRIRSYPVESSEIGVNTPEDFNYLSKKYNF